MPDRTVLVLGGGIAGVAAARALRRALPRQRILVVDRAARASYPPSFAAVAVGELRGRTLLRDRARLARRGVEFINAEVHHIDLEARHVRAESRELRFDYLVVALGREPALDAVPGLADSGQGLHNHDAAERLAATLRYFAGGTVLVAAPDTNATWAPAPYELAMLLEHHFHERKMRQKVEIAVWSAETAPLAEFGAEASEMTAGLLAHKGIEFAGRRLVSVDAARHHARSDGDGPGRDFNLLVAFPPSRAPAVLAESGLASATGDVIVDPLTLETRAEGVFALGDVAAPASGAWPRSAGLARRQAAVVADHVASRLGGAAPTREPDGSVRWFVEVGAGAAMMLTGDVLRDRSRLRVAQPSIVWHWAKALAEKDWLFRSI